MATEKIIPGNYFRSPIPNRTFDIKGAGIKFNTQRAGMGDFYELRGADYGSGFRMPTIPELTLLIHGALKTQDHEITNDLLKTLRCNWLTGNMGIFYSPKGIFFQDNPPLVDNQISMKGNALEEKLGKKEEKGVFFSDDGAVRFVPYGFKLEEQDSCELSKNLGIIALTGSLENAEKLAEASRSWKLKPGFYATADTNSPQIKIPGFGSDNFDGRLIVSINGTGNVITRYSFGVSNL